MGKVGEVHRNSYPEVLCQRAVPEMLAKLTGKHLCQSLFLNIVRPAALLKKIPKTGVFL